MRSAMAKHILVKTKDEAEQLKQRLARGEGFGKLAEKAFYLSVKEEGW